MQSQYVDADGQSPEDTYYFYRGTSASELKKIFEGGEFGADWGTDFDYSSGFADGYAGGGAGAVMVADRKTNGQGKWLIPDPQDIVALLEPFTGRILWEKNSGFKDHDLEGRIKTAGPQGDGQVQHTDHQQGNITKQNPEKPFTAGERRMAKFSIVMVGVSGAAAQILDAARGIPEEELGVDGYEHDPHITVKYGAVDDLDVFRDTLKSVTPFNVKLGKVKVFIPSESSGGQAPIVVEAIAPELTELHNLINSTMSAREDDFPYKPHVTLAYVKPEFAEKYEGSNVCEGISFRVDSVIFSRRDRSKVTVPLEQGVAITAAQKFVKQVRSKDEVLVPIDPKKFDPVWKKDQGFYVGPGGSDNAIAGRYKRFEKWLVDHPTTPIEAPIVSWNEYTDCPSFSDGRHRFAVLRDQGVDKIYIAVPKKQVEIFKKFADFSRADGQGWVKKFRAIGIEVEIIGSVATKQKGRDLDLLVKTPMPSDELIAKAESLGLQHVGNTTISPQEAEEVNDLDPSRKFHQGWSEVQQFKSPWGPVDLWEIDEVSLTASHKTPPLSDTQYEDQDGLDGEGTNAYADVRERVKDTREEPALETLAPQLFKDASFARQKLFLTAGVAGSRIVKSGDFCFVAEEDMHLAKGKIKGEVYLLHFNIRPDEVIQPTRDDARKPFHARHYLGWAENAQSRIQEHREGTAARLTQHLKSLGITFEVAKIWADATRAFERRLKDQGGLSRHCPICINLGIDRESIGKKRRIEKNKEIPAAPATPTTGPDFLEETKISAEGLLALLRNLRPELASDAQLAYDDWAGDDGRGLCTTLAEGMAYTINKELGHNDPYNISQEEAELKGRASDINDEGSHHFWTYVEKGNEKYGVDIPYGLYERSDEQERMFKIPGVKITPDDVHVFPVKGIDDTPWDAIPNYKRAEAQPEWRRWMIVNGDVVIGTKNELHWQIAERFGMPSSGYAYDKAVRGSAEINSAARTITLRGYKNQFPPNSVIEAFQHKWPGYKLAEFALAMNAKTAAPHTILALTPEARQLILKKFPPKFSDVKADHVTLEYGVPKDSPTPPPATVIVVGYASDDSLEALAVTVDGELKRPDGKVYHITLSLDRSKGRTPVESAALLAQGFNAVPHFDVQVQPQVKTAAHLYNGGSGKPGRFVTYYTPNKEMAESYVAMFNDRYGRGGQLNEVDVNFAHPAPWDLIQEVADEIGLDNGEYTPASIFDEQLHGARLVSQLLAKLKGMGYDGAILDDIAYGKQIQDKAWIKFSSSPNDLTPEEQKVALAKLDTLQADKDSDYADAYNQVSVKLSDLGMVNDGWKYKQHPASLLDGEKYSRVKNVPLAGIGYSHSAQDATSVAGLKSYIMRQPDPKRDGWPEVAQTPDGKYHVISGHTRLGAVLLSGRPTGKARVYQYDQEGNLLRKKIAKGDNSKITPQILEQAGELAREKLFPDRDAQNGDCEPVSDAIYDILKARGFDPWINYGTYRGEPHTWIMAGDLYVDASHDQFMQEDVNAYVPIRVGRTSDADYKADYSTSGHRTYASLSKHAFRIEVPKAVRDHFWEEPPEGNLEFWAYRHAVNVLPGEKIVFTFDGAPIASAVCHHVEEPGQFKCENTGKYEKHHKVYWDPKKFKRLDGKTGAALRYVYNDPMEEDLEDYSQEAYQLAKSNGINILSDKEPLVYVLDAQKLVGCLFVTTQPVSFSFDVVVDPAYQGRGIGNKLVDLAEREYRDSAEALDLEMELDVVNPKMKRLLESRGYHVVEDRGDRWVMTKTAATAAPMSLKDALESLRPQIIQVAQKVYDENAAANLEDPEFEHGICDEIAQEISGVIAAHIADVEVRDGGQDGDDHAWVIAFNDAEAYGVDIPPGVYESGGGYSWTLHENVKFQPTDVQIWEIDIPAEDLRTAKVAGQVYFHVTHKENLPDIMQEGLDPKYERNQYAQKRGFVYLCRTLEYAQLLKQQLDDNVGADEHVILKVTPDRTIKILPDDEWEPEVAVKTPNVIPPRMIKQAAASDDVVMVNGIPVNERHEYDAPVFVKGMTVLQGVDLPFTKVDFEQKNIKVENGDGIGISGKGADARDLSFLS